MPRFMPAPFHGADRLRACRRDNSAVLKLFAALILLFVTNASQARERARIETHGGTLIVNRRPALTFVASGKAGSRSERAEVAAQRLEDKVAEGVTASGIHARRLGKIWSVMAGGTSLLTLTRADARASHTKLPIMASRWTAGLRAALSAPPITLSSKQIVIPLGETRVLKVGGWAAGAFSSAVSQRDDHPAVRADRRDNGHRLLIRGENTGRAVVRIASAEDAEAKCLVVVKKWAGRVPTDLTAEVTGSPSAPPDLIVAAAQAALRRVRCEPGTYITALKPPHTRRSTHTGDSQTVTAPIAIQGSDYLTVRGVARIRVFNRSVSAVPAARLLYSNSPEHIKAYQSLYSAALTGATPTRIMFHHDNQLPAPVTLAVTVTNPTDKDLRLHIVPGFVSPGSDPATVGYRTGQMFLRNWMKTRGEIVSLPAHSTLPLLLQKLPRNRTASGIAQIALLDAPEGVEALLRVASLPLGQTGFAASAQNRLDPWRFTNTRPADSVEIAESAGVLKRHTSYDAGRTLEASYTVGQRWTFVPLGHPGVYRSSASNGDKSNTGDYGVLYSIKVTIQNPLGTSQKVDVAFGPGGGPAMAVFDVGGRYVAVNQMRPPEQRSLASLTLRPHETRVVNIQTVPLGGSTYPANVIVR